MAFLSKMERQIKNLTRLIAAEVVEQYSEAGVTWWVELEAEEESFEGYRERIRNGPPKE